MRSIADINRKLKYKIDIFRYIKSLYDVQKNKNQKCRYNLGVCVIVKNEGNYIEEWIRYHQLIGIDIIYLYDNDSNDNTYDKLLPFINSGYVLYEKICGHGRQLDAYNNCLKEHRFDCKYLAFIDADEFIFKVDTKQEITSIIDSIMELDNNAGGIAINWRMFGSSGLEQRPESGGGIGKFPLAC